ncbi:transmembrane protein 134-like [Pollicipes pollicipes]|uniref:transmembrane protein 134-like n=1 Tax=Pollicipes pollicipes TaxID=41117 RepID=UPI001884E7BF|nr:transmembrane protein 134-like [Pollicipes pollicipes]XP_037092911.1 transmembrane protein 134-like [Pollicipes pollicipes]
MAAFGWAKPKHFTIEDAFEEEPEDAIRLYGSTMETKPLNSSEKYRVRSPQPARGSTVGGHLASANPSAALLDPAVHFCPGGPKGHDRSFDDSVSHDSESLIGQGSVDGLPPSQADVWWSHPKVQDNKKIVICAFGLMIVGILLLATGVIIAAVPIAGFQSFVFIMAGALCFIPGAYHIAFIYLAVKGRRGYSFQQLPLFN